MPKVIFVEADGKESVIDATIGESVMAAAAKNGVRGIVAECGGNKSCATCHVWVRDDHFASVGQPDHSEDDLLDLGVEERRATSRLSCQIVVTEELDGLVVDVPPTQG